MALRKGLKECSSKIVLRFDTDDIYFRDRAYYIVKELAKNNIDIVGSNIYEFDKNPENLLSEKNALITFSDQKTIIFRNPINS